MEIVVCDGGSEDNTRELVEEFAENNKKVSVQLVTGLKGNLQSDLIVLSWRCVISMDGNQYS